MKAMAAGADSTPLTAELSQPAARLYRRLLRDGPVEAAAGPAGLGDRGPVPELLAAGFAQRHGDRLYPVEPARVAEHLLLQINERITEQHATALRLRSELERLARLPPPGPPPPTGPGLSYLPDAGQACQATGGLLPLARREVLVLTAGRPWSWPGPAPALPPDRAASGVSLREVCARECLEDPAEAAALRGPAADGRSVRVAEWLPLPLLLVDDRAALVPLDPAGPGGWLLAHSAVLVAALRDLFERIWRDARPYPGGGGDELDPVQQQVLTLLVAGMKDEAAARSLRISVRTLRRHVVALQRRCGVDSRMALAAAAARAGWLD
jgi:DNA-binding CsgD family transcriptional regulator